jgi:hypothetical protein
MIITLSATLMPIGGCLKLELSSLHGDRLKHLARLETNLARLRPLLVADAAVAKYKIDITQAQEHSGA